MRPPVTSASPLQLLAGCLLGCIAGGSHRLLAQAAPAVAPAGTEVTTPLPAAKAAGNRISPKALREADEAYIRGARALDHRDLRAAEQEFLRATELNPQSRDYALALAVTREHRLTELVQQAAVAQKHGNAVRADDLLAQARSLDPQNTIVRQHFEQDGQLIPFGGTEEPPADPIRAQRAADARGIGGPVELRPLPGEHSVHARGGVQEVLRALCTAFGLSAQFDTGVSGGPNLRLDLEDATFSEAVRTAEEMTGTLAVPLDAKAVFFARNTTDGRAAFEPLVEETLYMPGVSADALTEYAALARNLFDLRSVTAVGPAGGLVLRGDPATMERVNATFSDLVDSGAEVLLDLSLYEVDSSKTRTLGAATPSSVGVFPVASEAESLISANQSLISAAIAANELVLTTNPLTNAIEELGLLLASGVVSSTEFTSLLGTFGQYGGLPLAGVFLGSTTTFNAALNSSDVRVLDAVQLRVHSGQDGQFRAGTRYPIETGVYSSNLSNSLTAATAGLSINGTSVSSLLSQYLGSTSVNVPQIQFEDLGLTLKATPTVLRSGAVRLKLDFKVEALGSGTINGLPLLNNRSLTSEVTIPAGQSAMLASLVDKEEQRSIDGLPFLSELPGFQGTEKSLTKSNTELLISLTPHVVRLHHMEVASRRLLMPLTTASAHANSMESAENPSPEPEPQPQQPARYEAPGARQPPPEMEQVPNHPNLGIPNGPGSSAPTSPSPQ